MRIQVSGGRGGNGCSSFARTYRGIGAPNGGSGGAGGSVYVECGDDSARGFSFSTFHFRGQPGAHGTSDLRGRTGADITVIVPRGTLVSRIVSRDPDTLELRTELIADLHTTGQRALVARGGDGGWGNRAFVTGYRSNNRFSSRGSEGDSVRLLLELRTIADVGLVGFPNAGKSALLRALSNAQPKVADYPFTTLQPQVGVVDVGALRQRRAAEDAAEEEALAPDASTAMDAFTMADLPGLIDDAHLDVGLGHSFLQHLQRCPLLLYVIDVSGAHSQSAEGSTRDPCDDFVALRRELRLYDAALLARPWLVFANQTDRRKREAKRHLRRLTQVVEAELELEGGGRGMGVLSGSCVTGEGLDALVRRLWQAKRDMDETKAAEKAEPDRRVAIAGGKARVEREDDDHPQRHRALQ